MVEQATYKLTELLNLGDLFTFSCRKSLETTDLPPEILQIIDEYYISSYSYDEITDLEGLINLNVERFTDTKEERYYLQCLMFIHYHDSVTYALYETTRRQCNIDIDSHNWVDDKNTVYRLAYLYKLKNYYDDTFIPEAKKYFDEYGDRRYFTNLKTSFEDIDFEEDEVDLGCVLMDSYVDEYTMHPAVLLDAIANTRPNDIFKKLSPCDLGIELRHVCVYIG
jgi:hypothetical protein